MASRLSPTDIEYLPVTMVRSDLLDVPQYPMPAGFSLRAFHDGDSETWLAVQRAAEPYLNVHDGLFDGQFGRDLPAMPKRCMFLVVPDGRDVGTITAWYNRSHRGRRWGQIHWVAIVPAYQGRGLSKPMMTAAMGRLRSLGHRRAILMTHTRRIAAIKAYLGFGFVPEIVDDASKHAWRLVAGVLSHPVLDEALARSC